MVITVINLIGLINIYELFWGPGSTPKSQEFFPEKDESMGLSE